MRSISLEVSAFVVGLGVVACAAGDGAQKRAGSGGGANETGGVAGASAGTAGVGAAPSGGSGGSGNQGSGGTQSGGSGGSATGGQATGGSPSGGTAGKATGGGGTGGKACTNVRPTGTEWDEATCDQWATETTECQNAWMINGNYCNESCGRCSTGTGGSGGTAGSATGGTATGGTATGGTGPIDIPDTCTEADRQVCNNLSGQHCGYTFEYWKDQGSGCLTNTSNGFSVQWTSVNNLLGRKGRRPGSRNQVVTYQADYQPDGSSYLCVYGWTRNPLVEYYIVDSWGTWRPPGEEPLGTVTTDGGTYELYRTERVDAPSIDGTRTFSQYWSVRTAKRTSGTITVVNHFDAWGRAGMNMGSLYEVSMTVEGYQSSGTANVAMVMR